MASDSRQNKDQDKVELERAPHGLADCKPLLNSETVLHMPLQSMTWALAQQDKSNKVNDLRQGRQELTSSFVGRCRNRKFRSFYVSTFCSGDVWLSHMLSL